MRPLCEFAQDKSIGVSINVVCSKTDQFCNMIRYCTLEQRPVMTHNYYKYGCKLKQSDGDAMAKKRKPVEQIVVTHELKEKDIDTSDSIVTIIAKVNFVKNNKTSVQYPLNGHLYNITIDGTYSGNVKISYRGTLTNKSIISVEQM